MTEVRLQRSGIVAAIGERVPTSVAEHVRVCFERELCLDAGEKQGFNITLERSLDPAASAADVFPRHGLC